MRKIDFDPPATLPAADQEWWKDWSARAKKAVEKQIDAWETWVITRHAEAATPPPAGTKPVAKKPPGFNDDIWTEFKERLLKSVFGDKCAYCESGNPVRWSVQVEHFRPKGEVSFRTEEDGPLHVATTSDPDEKEIDHPGYFWLAYNWRNLLPCCAHCNSGKGKNTQFPIATGKRYIFLRKLTPANGDEYARAIPSPTWKGMYYPAPEDLDRLEDPQLINPYIHKPSEHIVFGIKGVGTGITPKGEHSMNVFNLRDEDLRQKRQKAQEEGFTDYTRLLSSYTVQGENLATAKERALKKLADGRPTMEYSAAVFDALPKYWNMMAPM